MQAETGKAEAFLLIDGERSHAFLVRSDPTVRGVRVRRDTAATLTSQHVSRLTAEVAEDNIMGEKFTRDVPNVSSDALQHLDESGLITEGVQVRPGDLLVGRVQTIVFELSPEEKLLRAIFGENAGVARDTSLRCTPAVKGKVSKVERETTKKGVRVSVEITDLRELRVGDVLEIDGQSTVVSAIEDELDAEMAWGGPAGTFSIAKVKCAEDALEARAIGPYSMVTQQPLGGKAQFGGQRVSGAQIAALQAHGAWHVVHEMLTVKADDVLGRTRLYENIVRGQLEYEAGTPESTNVLLRELRALGFDVESTSVAGSAGSTGEPKPVSTMKDIFSFFEKPTKNEITDLRIALAGTARIREHSHGQVKKPETVNYRTMKPEPDGLFCARIFGPTKDYECVCGKYKRMKHRGVVCEKCGVEVIQSKVRRERFGHVEFPVPLLHPWAIESLANAISRSAEDVKRIIEGHLTLDLEEAGDLREGGVWALRDAVSAPADFFVDAWPVLPPELRPLVPLSGGRWATSDLNDLYRRLINRANRLSRLIELNAPVIIVRNEHRQLQEALNALVQNGRGGKAFKGPENRRLLALLDMISGPQGRLNQTRAGKRVDFSGAARVVTRDLPIDTLLLPRSMALELFKPWIYSRLEAHGYVTTIKSAKRMVDESKPAAVRALETGVVAHPVLAVFPNPSPNDTPRFAGFEVRLWDELAIGLSPDALHALGLLGGDVLTVHVPASARAIVETRALKLPLAPCEPAVPSTSGWVARAMQSQSVDEVLFTAAVAREVDPLSDLETRNLFGLLGVEAAEQDVDAGTSWLSPSDEPEPVPETRYAEHFDRPVSDLELATRTANALENAGIVYIGQLVQRTHAELLKTRNFARNSLREVLEILSTMGLTLGMPLPGWSAPAAPPELPPVPEPKPQAEPEPSTGYADDDFEDFD